MILISFIEILIVRSNVFLDFRLFISKIRSKHYVFRSLIASSLICYLLSPLFRKYFAIHIVLLAMISLTAVKVESLIPRTMIHYPQWWIANGSDDKTDIAFNFTYLNRFLKQNGYWWKSIDQARLWKRYIWIVHNI